MTTTESVMPPEHPQEQAEKLRAEIAELRSLLARQQARIDELEAELPALGDELRRAVYDTRDTLGTREAEPPAAAARRQTVRRIREVVRRVIPRGAAVIVVGKADRDLLDLYGRPAQCFPQTDDGQYAGHYPAGSTAAIAHLEAVRARGGDYLLIPEDARWWLDHYEGFRRHLDTRFRLVTDEKDTCVVYALRQASAGRDLWQQLGEVIDAFQGRHGRGPAILDLHTGLDLAAKFPEETIFSPQTQSAVLPYLDATVDVVVVHESDPARSQEATRVASCAVVSVRPDAEQAVVHWTSAGEAPPAAMSTSIIIPAFNGSEKTTACLTALRETLPSGFPGEIIVVDDASTDDTAERVQSIGAVDRRVRLLRNRANAGFVHSCNAGAAASTGDLLVFLNNDTLPLPGWLPALWRVFRERSDAGAVGGKLVYPSGRLQEAGGLVFCDGSAANFGRDDYNPDLPLYNFVREVDYCSAALLATRRSMFTQLEGFDTAFSPGYYEDTDYCFRVRAAGLRVYYQPACAVVHVEGGTAGLDVRQGMKRHQVLNQVRFFERWSDTLERQPARPPLLDFAALHALAARPAASREAL